MDQMQLRQMEPADRSEVAELICVSLNWGFLERGMSLRFPGGPAAADVFFQVYDALDPGCGVVAANADNGRLMGSCFFHPRPTHVSVGIMNVHPSYFRQGVARALLRHVIELADAEQKPLRLVSSALNLDSFSLYTRAGFVPRRVYQDMFLDVPKAGLGHRAPGAERVREATADDVAAMTELEQELVGIRREKDFCYFTENGDGFWHVSVYDGDRGGLEGFMVSSAHPGCNMIGPGLARTQEQAAALLLAELDRHRGRRPVTLLPVDCDELVRQMYDWGGRNCELHFGQVRGQWQPIRGVNMPTFLPESA
jgi:GNAT superfamily N-acetyltransferase